MSIVGRTPFDVSSDASSLTVGRVTFGPAFPVAPAPSRFMQGALTMKAGSSHACNCMGPQPGEKLCPCMLRAESAKGRQMVAEGVVIDGVEYDLVPRRRPLSDRMSVGE